jgi:hypothetical protein
MGIEEYTQLFAMSLVRHSPVLLVGIVGLWYSATRRLRLSGAYGWALSGFSVLSANAILSAVRDVGITAVRVNAVEGGRSTSEVGMALTLWSLPAYVALLAALLLLACAVFMGRSGAVTERQDLGSVRPFAA